MDRFYWHISAYLFTPLKDLTLWRERLRIFLSLFDAKGTILVSPEGLNIALSIAPQGFIAFQRFLKIHPETRSIWLKPTTLATHCFSRMVVKIKPHLIPFPTKHTQNKRYIAAEELDASYQDFVMLDVRNDYEVRLGTFANAHDMDIQNFTDLPEKLERVDPELKKTFHTIYLAGAV